MVWKLFYFLYLRTARWIAAAAEARRSRRALRLAAARAAGRTVAGAFSRWSEAAETTRETRAETTRRAARSLYGALAKSSFASWRVSAMRAKTRREIAAAAALGRWRFRVMRAALNAWLDEVVTARAARRAAGFCVDRTLAASFDTCMRAVEVGGKGREWRFVFVVASHDR